MILNKTWYYYLILFSLVLTSMMSMFMNDILMIWLIMEINNFMFIYLLNIHMNNKKIIFLFFFIQLIASSLLIFSLTTYNMMMFNQPLLMLILMFSLTLKLGIPPLHLWIPLMLMHMDWMIIFIFLTVQKIIPFMMLSKIPFYSSLMILMIILSMIMPPFYMLNVTNFKKLLAYSSINQMGWMIFLMFLNTMFWMFYMLFYSFSMYLILIMFKLKKMKMNFMIKSSYNLKLFIFIMMMNIASLPPFSFFIMKWFSIFLISFKMKFNIILFLMLFSSLFMVYIYNNMIIKMTLLHSYNSKYLYLNNPTMNKFNFMIINFLIFNSLIILMILDFKLIQTMNLQSLKYTVIYKSKNLTYFLSIIKFAI